MCRYEGFEYCQGLAWIFNTCTIILEITDSCQPSRKCLFKNVRRHGYHDQCKDSFSRFREDLRHTHVPDELASNRAMTFSRKTHYLTKRPRLLPHRAGATLAGIGLLCLGLRNTLGEDLGILALFVVSKGTKSGNDGSTYSLLLDLLGLAALERNTVALVLQTLGSDQTLNARSLGVRLLALTLGLHLATNDVLADLLPKKYHISLHVYISDSTPTARSSNCPDIRRTVEYEQRKGRR